MSTEYNYVVNLDTTRVMGQVADIRSQVGMAFGSPTGFAAPAMALPGGGFGQLTEAASGAASGFRQMMAGLGSSPPGGSGFGGTFTNPAIANTPHYGAIQAITTPGEERAIHYYGVAAAQDYAPPGVSPGEYAMAVNRNYMARQSETREAATAGAIAGFTSSAAGLAAGSAAGWAGAKALAAMAPGPWKAPAAILGGIGGWMLGEDLVGGHVRERFADAEKAVGVAKEMGEIVGAGRNLRGTQRFALGRATVAAAKDLNMDVNEMGDIMALSRGAGLLPKTTDPAEMRTQAKEFARSVDEAAQVLHTSIAGAVQVIKNAATQGKDAKDAILAAAGMGGADAYNRYFAFGRAGSQFARANEMSGAQGFALFTGALGQAAGAGMTGEELRIMGGRYGAAQMIAGTQIAASQSPLGAVQLMAAGTGEALGGIGELPGQALAGLAEMGGGDLIAGAINFQTNEDRIRRGIGAEGVRTQARHQIDMLADQLMNLSPNITRSAARTKAAMSLTGYSSLRARTYAQGLFAGPGTGVSEADRIGNQIMAYSAIQTLVPGQRMESPGLVDKMKAVASDVADGEMGSFASHVGVGWAVGTITPFGPITGTVGAIGGAAVYGARRLWNYFTDDDGAVGIEEARMNLAARELKKQDDAAAAYAQKIGALELDEEYARRVTTANYGSVQLDIADATSNPRAINRLTAAILTSGMKPVGPGKGTIRVGSDYFSATEMQSRVRAKPPSQKQKRALEHAARIGAYQVGQTPGAEDLVSSLMEAHEGGADLPAEEYRARLESAMRHTQELISRIDDTDARLALQADFDAHGLGGYGVRQLIRRAPGGGEISDHTGRMRLGQTLAAAGPAAYEAAEFDVNQRIAAEAFGYDFNAPQGGGRGGFWGTVDMVKGAYDRSLMVGAVREARQTSLWSQGKRREALLEIIQGSAVYNSLRDAKIGSMDRVARDVTSDEYRARYQEERTAIEATNIGETVERVSAGLLKSSMVDKAIAMVSASVSVATEPIEDAEGKHKEGAGTLKNAPPGKKGRPGRRSESTMSRAIGFGEQESAMSTINRALKRTAKSVDILHRRIKEKPTKVSFTLIGGNAE